MSLPPPSLPERVAIVHEWLTEWGGSEDVTRVMLECLPAQLFATIDFLPESQRARIGGRRPATTFLQRAPFVRQRFWNYLPLTPLAVETHDVRAAELVVSSSHAFAKGVLVRSGQLHVSYVHSPMRYAWDLHEEYLQDYGLARGLKGLLARYLFHRLRAWDRQTSHNVDLFLANSHYVRRRIWRSYRRRARVLYPPVQVQGFPLQLEKGERYVTVSRLVSYKRIDLLLDAFRLLPNRRLVVIGDGPEAAALRRNCPPNVEMLGFQPIEVVRRYLGEARAFVFAANEDFGISPVEAQACGTPVIAFGVGGATETVRDLRRVDRPTGLLFGSQTPQALADAVERFEREGHAVDPRDCRAWAERFDESVFRREFLALVGRAWAAFREEPSAVEAAVFAGEPEPGPPAACLPWTA